jgi:hypothetical protein
MDEGQRKALSQSAKAHRLHAMHDSRDLTAAARAQVDANLERAVDPEGALPPEEVRRRVQHLRRARMLELALLSAEARSKRSRGES